MKKKTLKECIDEFTNLRWNFDIVITNSGRILFSTSPHNHSVTYHYYFDNKDDYCAEAWLVSAGCFEKYFF